MLTLKLFDIIPYEIRKDDEYYIPVKQAEEALREAFSTSFVAIRDISSVYLDNKYNSMQLNVSTYKGIVPEKNDISAGYTKYIKEIDEDEYFEIIVHYIESDEVFNLVKYTSKQLDMTYKQLGEAIGYKEGALKNAITTGKVSEPMQKALELYTQTIDLKKRLKKAEDFKQHLKDFLK